MLFGLFKKKKNVAIEEATEPVAKEQESIARTELGKQVIEHFSGSNEPIFLSLVNLCGQTDYFYLRGAGMYNNELNVMGLNEPHEMVQEDPNILSNFEGYLEREHYACLNYCFCKWFYLDKNEGERYIEGFSKFEKEFSNAKIVGKDEIISYFDDSLKKLEDRFKGLSLKGIYSLKDKDIKDKGFYIQIKRKLKIGGIYYIEYNESDYSQRFDNEINMCSIYDDVFSNIVEAKEFISYSNNRKKNKL